MTEAAFTVVEIPGVGLVEVPNEVLAQPGSGGTSEGDFYDVPGPNGMTGGEFLKETGRVLDQTVRGGLFAIPNAARDLTTYLEHTFPDSSFSKMRLPIPQEVRDAWNTLSTPSRPETPAMQAVGNIGEAIVGAYAGPGGLIGQVRNLQKGTQTAANTASNLKDIGAVGLGSGVGGEAAAQLTDDDNPLARVVGSILGGGTTGIATSMRSNPERLIREHSAGLTDVDYVRAIRDRQTLTDAGVPSLASQFLGDNSTLADLLATAGGNSQVRSRLTRAMSNVPSRAEHMVQTWKDANLPPQVGSTGERLRDIQELSADAIQAARESRTKEWKEVFDATLAGQKAAATTPQQLKALGTIPKEVAEEQYARLTEMAEKRSGTEVGKHLDALRGKLVGKDGELILDGEHVNDILKDFSSTLAHTSKAPGGATKSTTKYMFSTVADLEKRYGASLEPFRKANEAYKLRTDTTLNPMQRGLVGNISRIGGGLKPDKSVLTQQAHSLVYPKNRNQANEIKALGRDIGPDGVAAIFGESLTYAMGEAVKMTKAGNAAQQPFDFVARIAGTAAQRANIKASLEVIGDGDPVKTRELTRGFYKMMRALSTTKNVTIGPVDSAGLALESGTNTLGALATPQNTIRRVSWLKASNKTYSEIVDKMLAPDGIEQLRVIGQSKDPELLKVFVNSVLLSVNMDGDADQPQD